MNGRRFGARLDPPRIGQHTRELLAALGYNPEPIRGLIARKVVTAAD